MEYLWFSVVVGLLTAASACAGFVVGSRQHAGLRKLSLPEENETKPENTFPEFELPEINPTSEGENNWQ